MSRSQKRAIEKKQSGKKEIVNHRVPHLEATADVMKSLGREFVFDKDKISEDRRLYQLYNLPCDTVMRDIVRDSLVVFEEALILEQLNEQSDIIKLDMFMTYFDAKVKEGFFTQQYEAFWSDLGVLIGTDLSSDLK